MLSETYQHVSDLTPMLKPSGMLHDFTNFSWLDNERNGDALVVDCCCLVNCKCCEGLFLKSDDAQKVYCSFTGISAATISNGFYDKINFTLDIPGHD